ncbi:MAG TPA: hypothetical protein EYN70_02060 [Planctomycetaceae bacterium]|nr:hypothetical protein [Planctomycetaceae bacterium]
MGASVTFGSALTGLVSTGLVSTGLVSAGLVSAGCFFASCPPIGSLLMGSEGTISNTAIVARAPGTEIVLICTSELTATGEGG